MHGIISDFMAALSDPRRAFIPSKAPPTERLKVMGIEEADSLTEISVDRARREEAKRKGHFSTPPYYKLDINLNIFTP